MPDVTYANGPVPTLRRSKTLRSRSAQALRSIKNVGKAPRRPTVTRCPSQTKVPAPAQAPPIELRTIVPRPIHTQSSLQPLKKRESQPLSNLFGLGLGGSAIGANISPSHSKGFRTLRSASASTPALQLFTDGSTSHIAKLLDTQPEHPTEILVRQSPVHILREYAKCRRTGARAPTGGSKSRRARYGSPADEGWDDSEEDYDSPRRHVGLGPVRRPPGEGSYPGERKFSFGMSIRCILKTSALMRRHFKVLVLSWKDVPVKSVSDVFSRIMYK